MGEPNGQVVSIQENWQPFGLWVRFLERMVEFSTLERDRSKAGSWLWSNGVLAKFSRQKTEEAQEGRLLRTWIQTKPKN